VTVHAIRPSKEANENVVTLAFERAQWSGDVRAALDLDAAIWSAISTLATNPRRFVAAPEEAELLGIDGDVRRMLIPLSARFAVHALYRVSEDEDGPVVRVIHVRDARRAPMTPDEAGDIRVNQ
jgi:hypothetical protein